MKSNEETIYIKVLYRDIQLYRWQLFNMKSFKSYKFCLKFLHFEIQNFLIASDGETTKTKVVDLKDATCSRQFFHLKSFIQEKF